MTRFAQLARLARTLSHLRASQIVARGRHQLRQRRSAAPAPSDDIPPLRPDMPAVPDPRAGRAPAALLDELGDGRFTHLNAGRTLGREHPDWRLGPHERDRLWHVTLHYHGWVSDLAGIAAGAGDDDDDGPRAAALLRHYLGDWLARCPADAPGAREFAWHPFTIASRLPAWIRAHQLARDACFAGDPAFERAFLRSAWTQAAVLHDQLEWHLRTNHLMRNLAGLAWAGRFFAGPEADRWRATAARHLPAQLDEQVLDDGGHVERSPMYHLQVMEDVLALALLLDEPAAADARRAWAQMADAARWMRHADGSIALYNDAARNGAPAPDAMLACGAALGLEPQDTLPRGGRLLRETGLAVWHGDPWSVLFDVGAVGPDHQPGHAHADTLAVACDFAGAPLFVDPGTFAYDHDDRRRYDRSTAAHNTVCVDGRDSSEVWQVFRVGRRARPLDVAFDRREDGVVARAAHDGYRHLAGCPTPHRRVQVGDRAVWTVDDRVDGAGVHDLTGGWLLAPGWDVEPRADGWTLRGAAGTVEVDVHGPAGLTLSTATRFYHPEFGIERTVPRLGWSLSAALPVRLTTTIRGRAGTPSGG